MFDLFYKNRRLLMLAIALIVVTGLSSIMVLPRLEDPILKQRAALIFTDFPGATAVRVEALVTEPLEESLKEIEEIRIIRSGSRNESSTITIELHDYVEEVENIWARVRDKLNDASPRLPEGATSPFFVDLKFSAYAALYSIKWDGPGETNHAIIGRYAELLEQEMRNLPGTDDIDLFGMKQEEIVVEVDQQQLAALQLTAGDVAAAIKSSDAKVSAGGMRGELGDIVVEVDSELKTLDQVSQIPIKTGSGTVVSLGDVATIKKAIVDPPATYSMVDGDEAIVLGCFVQPSVRIDHWTEDAQQLIETFREQLPEGIALDNIFLQEPYVTQRLSNLLFNLALGASAVTLVILLMMGWRSALIIGSALPLSGLLVLGGLRMLGIPLQQMSVTGLIIALGLLIDNAIVAVDQMRTHLQEGKSPSDSIKATVRHLAVPLMGSTFTTCLAFAPLALMPGPAGEFVGSIGVSVILAVTGSLFLSLTIIPAFVGILEKNFASADSRSTLQHGFGNEKLYVLYRKSLEQLFKRPVLGLVLGVILPIVGFIGMTQLPEQFFPPSDRDQFQIALQMPPQSSIHETIEVAERAREIALASDDVDRLQWFVGESSPAFYYNMLPIRSGIPTYAQAMVEVADGVNVTEAVQRTQVLLQSQFPEVQFNVRQLEQGPPVDAPIMIRVYGYNLSELREIGDQLRLLLSEIPEVVSTFSDVGSSTSRMSLRVKEDEARLAGLSHLSIAGQLRTALDGEVGGSLVEGTEVIPVRIKLKDDQRASQQQLQSFNLVAKGVDGQVSQVPVDAIADWRLVPGDTTIERINGVRMNEIQVQIQAGVLASEVLTKFQRKLDEANIALPAGYTIDFAGESAERNRAVGNLLASTGVLLVLMIAGLVLSFQSFRLAGLIGVVGALSVGLGLGALWWFGLPFGFMAIVGIMGLVGVAINDSIVVLAAIRSDEKAAAGDRDALTAIVFKSTRHVLSTTLTTIAGFIPLIMAGGGFWPPLAIAIAGGVTGATILALYFAPSAYLLAFGRKAITQ